MSQRLPAFLNSSKNPFYEERFIYLANNAAAMTPDEEENQAEEEAAEEQATEAEAAERRQQLESQIAAARVSPETKARMRTCLSSDNLERQNLVERLLRGEIKEAEFLRLIDAVEAEDSSWQHIFTTQREIRKKIQKLQWRTESYIELTRNKKYEPLVKEAQKMNRDDDMLDRKLKKTLFELTRTGVLQNDQAREIYEVDPLGDDLGFRRVLKKHESKITGAPEGKKIMRQLLALKNEEKLIESRFRLLEAEVVKLIEQSVSKINKRKEEERIKKILTATIGIRIKEGTEVEFDDPGNLVVPPGVKSLKISRVLFEKIKIRDSEGRLIDKRLGIPHIVLSNGAKMTPARFKKWADGAHAHEKIVKLEDVEVATGFSLYSIKIQKGMELAYPRRIRKEDGTMGSELTAVKIDEIDENARTITFNKEILFQPGLHETDPYDMRKKLSFGEFVKWFRRYEVEKSVSLQELQQLLKQYNDIENRTYGIEAAANPPILLVNAGEKLRSDELEKDFVIKNIEADGVVLENGEKYSFPEFFYWVKNFDVMKVPGGEAAAGAGTTAAGATGGAATDTGAQTPEEKKKAKKHGKEEKEEGLPKEEHIGDGSGFFGKLADIWHKTTFLSFKDIWTIGHEMKEFIKRRHERRSRGRVGLVGKRLPGVVGSEFERIYRSAETEEVSKYKEALEHEDIDRVKHMLYTTANIDVAKACIMTLVGKGEMRWDDHHLYDTLNKLTARHTLRGAELFIPHPLPRGKTGEDMARDAIDALWGKGIASEWFMSNISKFNSHKKEFEYKFKQAEADPKGIGGPGGECREMLAAWRRGEYVNPMEYEAMIDGAIKFGKMNAEQKMFYIIAGILTRQGDNSDGETLLSLDRVGELDSLYSNNFPLIDFFTQKYIYDPHAWDAETNSYGRSRKLTLADWEDYAQTYFSRDLKAGKPDKEFSRFMWEIMEMDHSVKVRMDKGIRNAENIDHDDAHFIFPLASPKQMVELAGSPTGGQKKYFTDRGYMNAYPGFNQFIVTLAYKLKELQQEKKELEDQEAATTDKHKKQQIAKRLEEKNEEFKIKRRAMNDVIIGFVHYDGIMSNIFKKLELDRKARLSKGQFESVSVVDTENSVKMYQTQLRSLVKEIGNAYGITKTIKGNAGGLHYFYKDEDRATRSISDLDEKKKQQAFEADFEDTTADLSKKMEEGEQDIDKALDIIFKRHDRARAAAEDKNLSDEEKRKRMNVEDALRLIPGCPRPSEKEIEELKKQAAKLAEQRHKHGGHH